MQCNIKIYNPYGNSFTYRETFMREHSMSELRDEIQNLSAVLELLQTEARAGQRPVLRLASDHLRLLARTLKEYGCGEIADPAAPLPPSSAPRPAAVTEACHVRQ